MVDRQDHVVLQLMVSHHAVDRCTPRRWLAAAASMTLLLKCPHRRRRCDIPPEPKTHEGSSHWTQRHETQRDGRGRGGAGGSRQRHQKWLNNNKKRPRVTDATPPPPVKHPNARARRRGSIHPFTHPFDLRIPSVTCERCRRQRFSSAKKASQRSSPESTACSYYLTRAHDHGFCLVCI